MVNLTKDYPHLNLNDTQNDPVLYGRGWKGAILTLYNFLIFYNETREDTFLGKTYGLGKTDPSLLDPNRISLSAFGSSYQIPLPPPLAFPEIFTSNFTNQ